MSDRVGQQLGNYRLVRLLGQGGFAEVYLGEHIYLETVAAIKVLHARIDSEDVEHFRAEARTVARLIHPHIVRVLEFGVEETIPYLVVDYAPNGTLRRRYPRGSRVPLETVVGYVRQIADALQYAHEQRVIHRDIKPENMLIGRRNEILLSDFGIALVAQTSRYQSTKDMQDIAGTVAYMAPEQIQSQAGPASDQYSLGIVVYEWLSGDRPFQGSFTEIAVKHALATPPPLRERIATIPEEVEAVVMKALAKDPRQRYPSVRAFARALEQAYLKTAGAATGATMVEEPVEQVTGGEGVRQGSSGVLLSEAEALASSSGEATNAEIADLSARTVPLPEDELLERPRETSSLRRRLSRRAVLAGTAGMALVGVGGALTWYAYLRSALETSVQPAPTVNIGKTIFIYTGHSAQVWGVAWSPDGKYIASASSDKTVQVWSAVEGRHVYTYTGHSDTVYSVAWSPDSKRIASASYDGTVQVWDAISGYYPFSYTGHTSWVWSVAWSHDGRYIASAGGDKTVQVWQAMDGGAVYTYRGHSGYVYGLAWSPDSKRLVSISSDRTAQEWNAFNGRDPFVYRPYDTAIWGVSWSHNGERIAVACDNKTVQLWDAVGGDHTYIYYGHADFVYAVGWSPDDTLIASGGDDKTVQVWNPVDGSHYYTYTAHTGSVRSLAWSRDGSRIASASWDKTVRVWQAK